MLNQRFTHSKKQKQTNKQQKHFFKIPDLNILVYAWYHVMRHCDILNVYIHPPPRLMPWNTVDWFKNYVGIISERFPNFSFSSQTFTIHGCSFSSSHLFLWALSSGAVWDTRTDRCQTSSFIILGEKLLFCFLCMPNVPVLGVYITSSNID